MYQNRTIPLSIRHNMGKHENAEHRKENKIFMKRRRDNEYGSFYYDISDLFHDNSVHKFTKDAEAFARRTGTCYTDRSGREYTYSDLASFFDKEDAVQALFDTLNGGTPEREMESSFQFRKCPRCGNWIFDKDGNVYLPDRFICTRCVPVRTGGRIPLNSDPYEDDRRFAKKKEAVFRPGLTTLIGCNGIGKTTLLNRIREVLEKRGVPFAAFNNLGNEGGERGALGMLERAVGGFDNGENAIGNAVTIWSSSEGEKIRTFFARFAAQAAKKASMHTGYGEMWFLFDALDSGLSVDIITDMKELVLSRIPSMVPENMTAYIIVSSNSYEMSEGTQCFSVERSKYVSVKTYAAFKKCIARSAAYKAERDRVFMEKAEIWKREYAFTFDKELEKSVRGKAGALSGTLAELEISGHKLSLIAERRAKNRDVRFRYRYERQAADGGWVLKPCDMECEFMNPHFMPAQENICSEMREWLCRKVYKAEKQNKKR